jgi:hypothetical protein
VVDGVNFRITGGAASEREAMAGSLQRVVGTKTGGQMVSALAARRDADGSIRPFRVNLVNGASGSGLPGSQYINISRRAEFGVFKSGAELFTNERRIAHELGHAAMGLWDSGPGGMNNINLIENPVMRQLGDYNDRVNSGGWMVPGR